MHHKITEDLVSNSVIPSRESNDLELKLKDHPGNPLRALFVFFYAKITGAQYPSGQGGMFSYRVTEIKKEEINIDELNNLLNALFQNRLLEDATHLKLLSEISEYRIVNSFHLVYRVMNLNDFYKKFKKEDQLEFFKQLKGENFNSSLLDYRKEKKLSNAIEQGELLSYLDFFKFCFNCRFFDFQPKKYNRNDLFKRLLKIFGELSYKSFVIDNCYYEITENDEIRVPTYKLINLSFQIAGKIFSHSYKLRDDLASKKYNYGYDIESFLELLNNTLTEFGFDYRFVVIDDHSGSKGALQEDYKFAICMIDKQMQHLFDYSKLRDRFLFIRQRLNFWPLLSYNQIQYALYHYKTREY